MTLALGMALADVGDLLGASVVLRRAATCGHPEVVPTALLALGGVQTELGDTHGALNSLRKAMDAGEHQFAAHERAVLLLVEGRLEEAATDFRHAMRSPDAQVSDSAALTLAELLSEALDDPAGAEEALRHALRSEDPEVRPVAEANLGALLGRLGRIGESRGFLERAAASGHPDAGPRASFNLGQQLLLEGDERGLDLVRTALETGDAVVAEGAARLLEAVQATDENFPIPPEAAAHLTALTRARPPGATGSCPT